MFKLNPVNDDKRSTQFNLVHEKTGVVVIPKLRDRHNVAASVLEAAETIAKFMATVTPASGKPATSAAKPAGNSNTQDEGAQKRGRGRPKGTGTGNSNEFAARAEARRQAIMAQFRAA